MQDFIRALETCNPRDRRKNWVFVPYDQLNETLGIIQCHPADSLGIVLVESYWHASRRPYHKQKIALLLANMRHFAIEQAQRGVQVRYVAGHDDPATLLSPVINELGPLHMMQPAERELRMNLLSLVQDRLIVVHPHTGWLTTAADFQSATRGKAS